MGSTPKDDPRYGDDEAQRRFETALRGARDVGHRQLPPWPLNSTDALFLRGRDLPHA